MPNDVSQELLDVVDENDNIIGAKTRGEIHRLGLMHRAVHILVFNEKGELFVQKRSMNKDNNPGLWDTSAAGHVDSGEDYLHCAMREFNEELGVIAEKPPRYLFSLYPTSATGMEHCRVYRYVHNGPFVLQPEEIDEGKWMSTEEMDHLCASSDCSFTEVLLLIWKTFRAD